MSTLLTQLQKTLDLAPPEITAPPYHYGLTSTTERFSEWVQWRKFALDFFPTATKLIVDVEGNRDDEGGVYYSVSNVIACDADGNKIEWDEETHGNYWHVIVQEDAPNHYSVFDFEAGPMSSKSRAKLLEEIERLREWVSSLPPNAFYNE